MKLEFHRLTEANIGRWESELKNFESAFVYPLGEDSFTISHGQNYLSFFRRIGRDFVAIVAHEGKIVGAGAGTISERLKSWYLCDAKVLPSFRGNKIPRRLFQRYFLFNYLKCQRGFALNMESADCTRNPIRKIMESLPWTPFSEGGRILFYYEDAGTMKQAMEVLSAARAGMRFSSLVGVKELILKSSGSPMPILHLEWGEEFRGEKCLPSPQEGKVHMWSLEQNDPLVNELKEKGIHSKASGLIYHRGMSKTNWSDLRTSEL